METIRICRVKLILELLCCDTLVKVNIPQITVHWVHNGKGTIIFSVFMPEVLCFVLFQRG